MKYRAEFAGVGEDVWSNNAVEYETFGEAKNAALDKLMVWTGADAARVVTVDTPRRQQITRPDDGIVAWYRS